MSVARQGLMKWAKPAGGILSLPSLMSRLPRDMCLPKAGLPNFLRATRSEPRCTCIRPHLIDLRLCQSASIYVMVLYQKPGSACIGKPARVPTSASLSRTFSQGSMALHGISGHMTVSRRSVTGFLSCTREAVSGMPTLWSGVVVVDKLSVLKLAFDNAPLCCSCENKT